MVSAYLELTLVMLELTQNYEKTNRKEHKGHVRVASPTGEVIKSFRELLVSPT